jgi:hypothetical protein
MRTKQQEKISLRAARTFFGSPLGCALIFGMAHGTMRKMKRLFLQIIRVHLWR